MNLHFIVLKCMPHSTFLADDDDEFDEDSIPGFTHPSLATPLSPHSNKGKGRAPEQLGPAPAANLPSSPVSGNIGSVPNAGPRPTRSTVGGVQVEMRLVVFELMISSPCSWHTLSSHTGVDTLDEPVSTTIVST